MTDDNDMGDLRIVITGDESRRRRRRYHWKVLVWREGFYGDTGWFPKYGGNDGDIFQKMEGYAPTMRKAEAAARVAIVPFQLTAPHDPGLPAPLWIEP